MTNILNKQDLVFSPLSILTAFGMILLGSKERTYFELKKTLCIDDRANENEIPQVFHEIINSYDLVSKDSLKIIIANRIFVQDSFELKEAFLSALVDSFSASIGKVDFGDPSAAADTINRWVAANTNNKIKNIIDPTAVGDGTQLVLTNAIYFKGRWSHTFNKKSTVPGDFYLPDNDAPISVNMMHLSKSLSGLQDDTNLGAQVLELPFVGGRFSMLLMLPLNREDGLPGLESRIANLNFFNDIVNRLTVVRAQVTLPKFRVESTIDLKQVMQDAGVSTLFSTAADLSGISDSRLFVNSAVHKAYLDVDENGAEAAAATAISMMLTSARITIGEVMVFTADHPFLAVIWDSQLKCPLFTARVVNPTRVKAK